MKHVSISNTNHVTQADQQKRVALILLCPCTKSKHRPAAAGLRVRDLLPKGPEDLAREWLEHAELVAPEDRTEAAALYSGPGWEATRRSLTAASPLGEARLLILSAGFGLVGSDERLPGYEASFAPGEDQIAAHLDLQGVPDERHRAWWSAINRARGESGMPCAALAERWPGARIVLAAGREYLAALREDLVALARSIGPERLFLISAGYPWKTEEEVLRACNVPLDIRTEPLASRGARSSLNVRLLLWLLSEAVPAAGWDRDAISSLVAERLAACPPVTARPVGGSMRMEDAQVLDWIREQLACEQSRPPSRSALLSRLRHQEGRSCEQKRFFALYEKIAHALRETAHTQ